MSGVPRSRAAGGLQRPPAFIRVHSDSNFKPFVAQLPEPVTVLLSCA